MHFSSSSSFLGLLFILLLSLAEAALLHKWLMLPLENTILQPLDHFNIQSGLNFRLLRQRVLQEQEEHAQQEAYRHLKLLAKDRSYRGKDTVIQNTIKQHVNHFNKRSKFTFNQRYWIFEGYWKKPNGPVFLLIGAGFPLSSTYLLAGQHMELAKKYGALLVALEHRFYGASIIPIGQDNHNLQFLSSHQALSDLASFHGLVTKKYKLTSHNTWICFGGSYAGNLAAWFRLKFPDFVFAAVASSAPVKAQLDFTGFNQVVARALLNPDIGGSKECLKAVAEAFAKVDVMLLFGNHVRVEKDFRACNPMRGPFDFSLLVTNLANIFMTAVVCNSKHISLLSVKFLCDMMTNHEIDTAYSRLITINQMYLQNKNLVCTNSSHWREVQLLQRTDIQAQGIKQWLFQKCTEFGHFRTCQNHTCPFSRYMTLLVKLDFCKRVFNIGTESSIRWHMSFTNNRYGADNPNVSRVLFVNGDMDPWHTLSVLRNQSGSTAILIKDASHCADMNPSHPNDPLPLVEARKQISSQVGTWLELARK